MDGRIARLNSLLQQALGDILRRYYLQESVGICITRVQVSTDLHYAMVYVSLLGGEMQQKNALKWLHRKKSAMRRYLDREIVLKFSPELHFSIDKAYLQEIRINSLLSELETEELPEKGLLS